MTSKDERVQELEQYLDCIIKEIDSVVQSITSESRVSVGSSPCVVDLRKYDFTSSIEGRRHVELLLVDLRRFLDKVVVTYCQIKFKISTKNERCIYLFRSKKIKHYWIRRLKK